MAAQQPATGFAPAEMRHRHPLRTAKLAQEGNIHGHERAREEAKAQPPREIGGVAGNVQQPSQPTQQPGPGQRQQYSHRQSTAGQPKAVAAHITDSVHAFAQPFDQPAAIVQQPQKDQRAERRPRRLILGAAPQILPNLSPVSWLHQPVQRLSQVLQPRRVGARTAANPQQMPVQQGPVPFGLLNQLVLGFVQRHQAGSQVRVAVAQFFQQLLALDQQRPQLCQHCLSLRFRPVGIKLGGQFLEIVLDRPDLT